MGARHRLMRTEPDPARPEVLEARKAARADFPTAPIGGCGAPMLIEICRAQRNPNRPNRRCQGPFLAQRRGDRDVAAEHAAIAEPAVARDGPKAARLLRARIDRAGARPAERIGEALPGAGR